jgi:hypothetical protein
VARIAGTPAASLCCTYLIERHVESQAELQGVVDASASLSASHAANRVAEH